MKELTKEEVLDKNVSIDCNDLQYYGSGIYQAMQEYSDQNTKQLIDEIAELKLQNKNLLDTIKDYIKKLKDTIDLVYKCDAEIAKLNQELDNIKIESSHEIADLVKTQQETQKQLDDTFHQLEGSVKHVEQLQSDLKAAESVNEKLQSKLDIAIKSCWEDED